MKLKQIIPLIAAIIIIGIAITVLTGPKTPETGDDNQGTPGTGGETPDSSGETPDSGDTIDVTEPATDDDGCLQIPPGISRDYEIVQVEGSVNETI